MSLGCSGFIGDEILSSYVWSMISHYKDPGSLWNNEYFMESKALFFFVAHVLCWVDIEDEGGCLASRFFWILEFLWMFLLKFCWFESYIVKVLFFFWVTRCCLALKSRPEHRGKISWLIKSIWDGLRLLDQFHGELRIHMYLYVDWISNPSLPYKTSLRIIGTPYGWAWLYIY